MKTAIALLMTVVLASCASVAHGLGPGAAERDRLWRQGHAAMAADSFRIATAAFQRLASEHPRTMEGREALFYIGTMALDPGNPAFDAERAAQSLMLYVAGDTLEGSRPALRRPEAEPLLALARELTVPCERRESPLRCDPVEIVRRVSVPTPGDPAPPSVVVVEGAEVARLQRQVAERDATIRQLREELRRIRETLAPTP